MRGRSCSSFVPAQHTLHQLQTKGALQRAQLEQLRPLILPASPERKAARLKVSASAMDAFNLFSDLCILTAGTSGGFSLWGSGKDERALQRAQLEQLRPLILPASPERKAARGTSGQDTKLLKLSSLQRTFGLELVESVLSGYEEAVKKVSISIE
jgi:hypothetical protein